MDLSLECPRQIHPLPARRLPRPDPPMRQTCDMTEPPNPFSREGAAGPPPSQPSVPERPSEEQAGAQSEAWPSYPAAPNSSGYDEPDIPTYGGGPTQPARPTDPYGVDPYPLLDPYRQADRGPYPASYPGPNPYLPNPYPPAPDTAARASTSPYGPAGFGANPYAAGPYGYTPTNHPQAVAALVLGVVGLVICSYVGIAAFIVGGRARKEILAQPQRYSGLGTATAGWVMGIVGIVLAVLTTLFFVIGLAGGWDS
jgi:hypothetical protein